MENSPFANTSCCYTDLTRPRGFWSEHQGDLPELSAKLAPRGQAASHLMGRFQLRSQRKTVAEFPDELLYRVFLKVCFDGPRKGLPHEPGYTNQCPYCGFVFPQNPYTPQPIAPHDKAGQKEWEKR